MNIRTLLPGYRLGPSSRRAVALALSASLSALGWADVQAAGLPHAVPLVVAQGGEAMAHANAPAPNPVLLQPGAEGDEVIMLQRQMRLQGLYKGAVDGRYGEVTKAAIAAFQTSAGLPATGTLDQVTWQRISTPQLLADQAPAAADLPGPLPSAEDAEPPSSPAAEGAADPLEAPETEPLDSATNRLAWFTVGGLALATCLGGWLWLGKGKRHSRAGGLPPLPPQTSLPPVTDPVEDTAPSAAPQLQLEVPAAADLPLEATTRLTRVDIVDSLVHELDSADSSARRHAIWELGQRGHSDVIQPLVNRLLEADSQEKSLILAALAEISSRSLKPMHRALALGLQDPSPEVRKNAIRDLSRVYDTVVQLSHMLAHASQDPDPGVQETAQWALTQLNRIPAAPYPSETTALDAAYDDRQTPTPESRRIPPS